MQSELGSLISRLRKRSYPDSPRVPNKEKSLLKEAKQIQSKIEIFTQDKDLAKKMHNDAVDFFSKDKMEKVDEQRDALIASFFFLNRKKIGDNLSKELELEQILSVLESLKGNKHIQLGTGQGKSSAVIPIAAMIHSLTSKEKDALVVSINQNLVSDLVQKVDELRIAASKSGFKAPMVIERKPQKQEQSHISIQKKMAKETFASSDSVEYSNGLKEELFTNYWGENISIGSWEAKNKGVEKKGDKKIPRVVFMTKDQFVFSVSEGKEAFAKSCPHVFFDEIDAPYIIGETYQTTAEDLYLTPSMITESVSRYIFDFVISQQLDPDEDFEVFSGDTASLSDTGFRRINSLDIEGFISGKRNVERLQTAFQEGLKKVADFLGLSEKEITNLEKNVKNFMMNNFQENLESFVVSTCDYIAQAHYWLNKVYLTEGENIVVRSEYFDQLLENHKFDPFLHLAILAKTEKFNLVSLLSKASQSAKFPTILSFMGEKIHGFSGTLSQRSLFTGELEESSLASFLKEVTSKSVFEILPRELKKPPSPAIVEDKTGMKLELMTEIEKMLTNRDSNQSLLLISHYDVKTTNKLLLEIKNLFPDLEIELAPSLPSRPEKLADYYDKVKRSCLNLANGKTKILISSGSLGIGANIVQSDGGFPNLKVGILGLPENESQLRQNLGRRRAMGNNFFWIVDKESLKERTTWLNDQPGKLIRAYFTPEIALEKIMLISNQPENKRLEFVLKLIHDASMSKKTNEEFIVRYDDFFRKKIIPAARYFLEKRIVDRYFKEISWNNKKDPQILKALKRLERLIDTYGLPDSLYEDCLRIDNTFGITSQKPAEFLDKLLSKLINENIIGNIIDRWFDLVDERAFEVENQFYGNDKFYVSQVEFATPPIGAIFISLGKKINFSLPEGEVEVELGISKYGSINLGAATKTLNGRIFTIGSNLKNEEINNINKLIVFQAISQKVSFVKIVRE